MDATRTKTDILNLALSLVGNSPLQQAEGVDTSALELPANAAYHNVLFELLEQYPWSFAIKRMQLARLGVAPDFGFLYRYRIPPEAMYFVGLYASNDAKVPLDKEEYELEGDELLTDSQEVFSRFVSSEVNTSSMTGSFVTALAFGMAARLARLVQGTADQIGMFEQQYTSYRTAAQQADTARAGINQIPPPEALIKARSQ